MAHPIRLKVLAPALLAAAGTVAAILYAARVASNAKTDFDVAILVFACAAALTGYLGLLVAWLGYRLEVGRVPKPDLAFLEDGAATKRMDFEIELLPPKDEGEVAAQLTRETEEMEEWVAKVEQPRANRPSNPFAALALVTEISDEDVARFRGEIREYLKSYEKYLRVKRAFDAVMARSREVIFAFTNDRAGAPAEGVRIIIQAPDDVRVLKRSDVPEEPEVPVRPKPPRAHSIFDTIAALDRAPLTPFYPAMRAMPVPAGNVSGPTIRSGSTEIEFTVGEVLHNLREDTGDSPLMFIFARPDTWVIRYEMHARNLPSPKRGELTIRTRVKVQTSPAESSSPPVGEGAE